MTSVTFGVLNAATEVSEIQAAAGMSTMFHSSTELGERWTVGRCCWTVSVSAVAQ